MGGLAGSNDDDEIIDKPDGGRHVNAAQARHYCSGGALPVTRYVRRRLCTLDRRLRTEQILIQRLLDLVDRPACAARFFSSRVSFQVACSFW